MKRKTDNYTLKTIEHPIYGTIQVKVYEAPKHKEDRKPRITKAAKKSLDNTKVVYRGETEPEHKRMYAGISSIYVKLITQKDGVSTINLSNDMQLVNCQMKGIKMSEATKKYLKGKACFDFIDIETGKSKLKDILPEVNTQDSVDMHSEEISGFNISKKLTSIDVSRVFKDQSFGRTA